MNETRTIEKLRRDHLVDAFDCGQETLNQWLRKHALQNQGAGAAQTYVGLVGETVIGYYSLAVGQIELADAPERLRKGLARHPAPVMLLARLAVDKNWQKQGVGRALLRDAVLRTMQAAEIAGIRALAVHAKDDAARRYYEQFDFEASPADPLHLLVLLKDIRRRVGAETGAMLLYIVVVTRFFGNNPGTPGVYPYMSLRWHWGRMLRITGVVVLALIASLAIFVQIQQHILRWRAERLLADIRELQSHKSTWTDAQKIMTNWGAWGSYEGACTAEGCDYTISIQDTVSTFARNHYECYPLMLLLVLPSMLSGEKGAYVEVTLRIKSGIVTESRYEIMVGNLIGSARAVNGFSPYSARTSRLLHPEYWIGYYGGCTGCIKFETWYTPLAGREKIRELTDFNFSCITRLLPCTTEADIMPTAWKQFQGEESSRQERIDAFQECKVPLEFYGREDETVVVADLISRHGPMPSEDNKEWSARLRVVRILKGKMPWPQGKTIAASNSGIADEINGWGYRSANMLTGRRYILFGSLFDYDGEKLGIDECGVVPYSEQNLAAIQRGIDAALARQIPER